MATTTMDSKTGTIIAPCNNMCKSDYQDTRYGRGMRVHNLKAKKETGRARCSVCGTTRH